MSDLVARLLNAPADGLGTDALCVYAADRITALQAQLAEARNEALEEAAVAVTVRAASIRDGWVYDARDRALISNIVFGTAAAIRAMKGGA